MPTPTESPTATPTPAGPKAAIVDLSNRRDETETASVRVVDTADGTVLLDETVTVAPPESRGWDDVVDPGTTVRVEVQVEGGKSIEREITINARDDGRRPAGIYIYLQGRYNDSEEIRISRPDL
ncbi:hypothetical protein BRC89_01335 [Halobacteriales archaeon QS_4_70_19]|nr:MAG: hypothetical protein BRC89_01335 [Halobacteriales archaeon QS_4_70_19]